MRDPAVCRYLSLKYHNTSSGAEFLAEAEVNLNAPLSLRTELHQLPILAGSNCTLGSAAYLTNEQCFRLNVWVRRLGILM